MLENCLAVGVVGFVGSVLRYLVGNAIPHRLYRVPARLAIWTRVPAHG
ncbi:MAG: hypothetical protein Q4B54_12295 [Coriobacteriales bacterium]|nr:hypothetical protein [Coriobacteriales bacterium]